jgi:hypothetical protein
MPRSDPDIDRRYRHGGKGQVFIGLLILLLGLMNYYQFSWPLVLMVIGLLVIIFGIARMMK